MKGYIHDSNHAPATLNAEAISLQGWVWEETRNQEVKVGLQQVNILMQSRKGSQFKWLQKRTKIRTLTSGNDSVEDVHQLIGAHLHVLFKQTQHIVQRWLLLATNEAIVQKNIQIWRL